MQRVWETPVRRRVGREGTAGESAARLSFQLGESCSDRGAETGRKALSGGGLIAKQNPTGRSTSPAV